MAEKKKTTTVKKTTKKVIPKKVTVKKKTVAKKRITKKVETPVIDFSTETVPSGETYSYKGWLNSDSFIKRCLAVLGYSTVGTLIFYGIIIVIGLLMVTIFAFISALT